MQLHKIPTHGIDTLKEFTETNTKNISTQQIYYPHMSVKFLFDTNSHVAKR